jgi:hypothetical protein
MLGLVIVVHLCLADNITKCKEDKIQITEEISLFQCMMGAQVEIAKYSEYHPRWKAMRWTCKTNEQVNVYKDM